MLLYMRIDSSYEIKRDLFLADSLEDRIHIAATALRDHLSNQGLHVKLNSVKTLARLFLQRYDLALTFEHEPKFVGDVIFIKASKSAESQQLAILREDEKEIPDDWWLHEIVQGQCQVDTVEGRHDTFLQNVDEIATLINSVLVERG